MKKLILSIPMTIRSFLSGNAVSSVFQAIASPISPGKIATTRYCLRGVEGASDLGMDRARGSLISVNGQSPSNISVTSEESMSTHSQKEYSTNLPEKDCPKNQPGYRPGRNLMNWLRHALSRLRTFGATERDDKVIANDETDRMLVNQCLRYADDLAKIYEEEKARRAELKEVNEQLAKEIDRRNHLEARLASSENRNEHGSGEP